MNITFARWYGVIAGAILSATVAPSMAQNEAPPPPYVMTGAGGVVIEVIWEEAAIRAVLPKGITPVADMAGGIVIYQVAKSYGLGPYSSAYFYVNVEGYDSPDGIKANWMLQGVYGPDPKVAQALKRYYHLPVRTGMAKIDATSDGTRYTGTIDGRTIVTAETRGGACEGAALFEHYPGFDAKNSQIVLLQIPEIGDWCEAELKSLDVRPPAGDAFAAFKVKSVKQAGEFKNWSFSFAAPKVRGKP